jgi:DNA-binding MarR family transcriptional regulator
MATAAGKRKRRKFDSLPQEVYLSLWRTFDRLRALEEELFDAWELTGQQYNVLRLLQASHPEPVPTLQLSNRLISRAPDITRMLDKLEQHGWIERLRSDEDRRSVMVRLTETGTKLLKKMSEAVRKVHVAQVGHLSVDEMRTLCDLLSRVREPHEPELSPWR